MPDTIEIWFVAGPASDGKPVLLETRRFDPAIDPPSAYQFGSTLLIAAHQEQLVRDGAVTWRVHMVDPA